MSFEIEGKLHKIYDTEQKTDSFRAREFVLEIVQGTYPQFIKFQLTQDRCEALDPFQAGQQIKVYFDLRGREWNGKYFTNLQAWRVEALDASQPAPMPLEEGKVAAPSDQLESGSDDFDDLPF